VSTCRKRPFRSVADHFGLKETSTFLQTSGLHDAETPSPEEREGEEEEEEVRYIERDILPKPLILH
jgi:hypothetical protein